MLQVILKLIEYGYSHIKSFVNISLDISYGSLAIYSESELYILANILRKRLISDSMFIL